MPHTLTTIPRLDAFGRTWTNVRVVQSWYVTDGSVAIQLLLEDGDILTTVSLNIEGQTPAEGCIFIKDYGENRGLADALQKAGIVYKTGQGLLLPPFDSVVVEARILLPLVKFDGEI